MRAPLLAMRIQMDSIELGRVYLIHARNGGIGVAVRKSGALGYWLHREKFGRHFLFVEYDWDEGPPFGTAIPLRLLEDVPPAYEPAEDQDEDEQRQRPLLDWLAEKERQHTAEIQDAWRAVLGKLPGDL
jgi:hypothetical protein